ncbi:MAG: DUF6519 domain-containing protein [Thermodesulfobacteriota bacterium]|nr:DUF6519 domain-containing protein [Thermodesulfobacteriota bacterium]
MSGDYSRHRFDPRNNYTGVKMQQGRVQLDADWNEWTDTIDRHTRAETVDTFGIYNTPGIDAVAVVSLQTPNAFLIEVSSGSFTIGQGRMYVNGLLAENFGDTEGPQVFDPVLAELRGQNPIAYAQQPYHPAPASLPTAGPHLAYLEVWQREVTHLQRPDLVEKAIGVDTTTRSQTVWQVRLLNNIGGGISCTSPDSDLAAVWDATIAPSTGRLSSRDNGVSTDENPCELPPSGGYRGLENQLYRIEIHDSGGIGTATFKWSRDNASVAARVVEVVSDTELKLASLGRDAVLRFNTNDWVEIIDDWRELSGKAGNPTQRIGEMRRITVDDTKQTISFSPALPVDLIPSGAGKNTVELRHLRVIRWDQAGEVRDSDNNVIDNLDTPGSQGVIQVPAATTWVALENGVQIRFSQASAVGNFRCNDYWTVVARTADTSVDNLNEAAPTGIHHHYARLALVTFPSNETDCRTMWPPDCGGSGGCCTVFVSPGDDIQAAIDSLPDDGGCVCLKTGEHQISEAIRISRSNVVLQGETPDTWIRSTGVTNLLIVEDVTGGWIYDIQVKNIRFDMPDVPMEGSELWAMVFIRRGKRISVRDCSFRMTLGQPLPVIGIWLQRGSDIRIENNRFHRHFSGVYASDVAGLKVLDNYLKALTYQPTDISEIPLGMWGVYIENEPDTPCMIEGNRIKDFWTGVHVNDGAKGSKIADNIITRPLLLVEGDDLTGMEWWAYGIEVEAADCRVEDNNIGLEAPFYGGILITTDHALLAGNRITSPIDMDFDQLPVGIYLSGIGNRVADYGVIRNNILEGLQNAILLEEVEGTQVVNNNIDSRQERGLAVMAIAATHSVIAENHIQHAILGIGIKSGSQNQVERNHVADCGNGIIVQEESATEVSGNVLDHHRQIGIGGLNLSGRISMTHNRLTNCGHSGLPVGIGIVWSSGNVAVESCEVIDTGLPREGDQTTSIAALGISAWAYSCRISNNRVAYTDPGRLNTNLHHRALLLVGPLSYTTGGAPTGQIVIAQGNALVSDNVFQGPGQHHLVEFMNVPLNGTLDLRFEKVTFNNNHCNHEFSQTDQEDSATVLLWGSQLIIMGNHVKAHPGMNSMDLSNSRRVTLMGNITTGNYIRVTAVVPSPIPNFNVIL